MMAVNRNGGVFVEILAAVLILGVSIAGFFALWSNALTQIGNADEFTVASQIARLDIEKAKAMGFSWLPLAPTFNLANINNAYPDNSDNIAKMAYLWTGAASYFDANGNRQAIQAPNAQTRYTLARSYVDVGIEVNKTNTSYGVTEGGRRLITTTVRRRLPDGTTRPVVTMSTTFAKGGL